MRLAGTRPLLGFVLLCAARLPAQALQGAVVDEVTAAPLPSVLVDLLGPPHDSLRARRVSDSRGRFAFPAVAAGSYRIRVNRIGFRPWISPRLTLRPGQLLDSTWRVGSEPVVLAELVVDAESRCASNPEADRQMGLAWEEARKSLGLLQQSGRADTVDYVYSRRRTRVEPEGHGRVLGNFAGGGHGLWPIVTQSPDSLARFGYVQPRDSADGPVYYGPDPAVFFSDPFLATHCFRLAAPPREHHDWIGLSFTPVPDRALPDIEGVLWLSREDATLRRLDYRYTGLWGWVPPGTAGGELVFDRLRGGQPVVVAWTIRAPVAARTPLRAGQHDPDPGTVPYFSHGRISLGGFLVDEATVVRILDGDGTELWTGVATDSSR